MTAPGPEVRVSVAENLESLSLSGTESPEDLVHGLADWTMSDDDPSDIARIASQVAGFVDSVCRLRKVDCQEAPGIVRLVCSECRHVFAEATLARANTVFPAVVATSVGRYCSGCGCRIGNRGDFE